MILNPSLKKRRRSSRTSERGEKVRTRNFSAVKPSESCERWMELRLGRSLFTSFKAFIFPLKEFVSRSLEREREKKMAIFWARFSSNRRMIFNRRASKFRQVLSFSGRRDARWRSHLIIADNVSLFDSPLVSPFKSVSVNWSRNCGTNSYTKETFDHLFSSSTNDLLQ